MYLFIDEEQKQDEEIEINNEERILPSWFPLEQINK